MYFFVITTVFHLKNTISISDLYLQLHCCTKGCRKMWTFYQSLTHHARHKYPSFNTTCEKSDTESRVDASFFFVSHPMVGRIRSNFYENKNNISQQSRTSLVQNKLHFPSLVFIFQAGRYIGFHMSGR